MDIGLPTTFGAYRHIRRGEDDGGDRKVMIGELMELFGDRDLDMSTIYQHSAKKG